MPDPTEPPPTLRLFGSFEAHVNGAPLPRLRSRKGPWLLALLALRHGREVERDWLAGTLWPESAPTQAAHSLRVILTDLRRALGREARRLQSSTRHTLCLDLAGVTADVVAFDAAVASGAPGSLAAAIALYRGPLLEGCAEEWAFPERQAREEAYLGALETLAAQAQSGGDPGEAEGYLRRVVATDPLRETAQRALMQVLAAAGNYAAAAQVYRDLRLRLHREINSEPDPETTALFQGLRAVARGQAVALPSAGRRGASSGLGALPAAPGGAERAEEFPALPRLSDFPHNLPLQLTRFVGREEELAAVKGLLATHRLVTLTGPGGGGKTRLALQVAADRLSSYADGVWLVALAPVRDPALVLPAVAAVFGVQEQPGQSLLAILTAFLGAKSLLLVLDNCEQVLAAAPQVLELLAGAPRVTVLATSRAPLHLHGEQEFPVPPLALPDPQRLPLLEVLSQNAAVALFLQQAQAVKPEFALTDENAPAVAEICCRLDGLPLAIELAAARVKLFSPAALLARLANRLELLTGGARDRPARHQTLRAAIAWNYDLLDEAKQALFRRLCVFGGGCTLATAESVCGGQWVVGSAIQAPLTVHFPPHTDVLDGLASLVNQSLLKQEEQGDGEPRFLMLETLREFGLERLAESGEAELARQRHRDYFLGLAEAAEPELQGRGQGEWLARVEGEHDNLRAAVAWCMEQGDAEAGLRLGGALWRFWMVRGYLTEGRQCLTKLLSLPGAAARTVARGRALHGAGCLAFRQGDYEGARAFLEEGVALGRELGDQYGIAWSLHNLGNALHNQGDYEAAPPLYEAAQVLWTEGLAIFRQMGDQEGIAWTLINLGNEATRREEYEAARALLEESLALHRELDNQRGIAHALGTLGNVARDAGEYETARVLGEQSLAISRALGSPPDIAWSLYNVGNAAREQREYEAARVFLEESLALGRKIGSHLDIAHALGALGHLALKTGEYARCAAYYRESLALGQSRDDRGAIAQALEEFAGLAGRQQQWERAVWLLGAAQGVAQTAGRSRPVAVPDEYQRTVEGARSALGEAAFAAAWEAGQAKTLDEAIRYALVDVAAG